MNAILDSMARPRACADGTIVAPVPFTVEDRAVLLHEHAHQLMRSEIAHLPQWRQEAEVSKAALRAMHDAGCSDDSFRRASRRLAAALSTYIEAERVARWVIEKHVPAALDRERWRG
jgi:hypothetical protein